MSKKIPTWRRAILPISSTVEEVIRNLNEVQLKIVLIVNSNGILEGTISDGDIRRGLLKGLVLNSPVKSLINPDAIVVPPELGRELVIQLMAANNIQQIPVVNGKRQIIGLHLWNEVASVPARSNQMIIMAGGFGTRLHPYTENCPKPLLSVAGKPMILHIIERAKLEGFTRFIIAIHHLGNMIEDYFGNGSTFGVNIEYLREQNPLGTAGALSLLGSDVKSPFVVTNGDVITDIRYGEFLDFHIRHSAMATMAVRLHEWQHPYGVVQTKGLDIVGFEEKPIYRSYINAGVYVIDPIALNLLQFNAPCDMPTLFERLQKINRPVLAFPMHEPWLDVGRPDDFLKANEI